ncbi:hypothetical protein HUJ05_012575 [Dendroctonus ponderosae]|nr:hypothetical protein HUJ05_012575 [Dendroctonus ponderosae]
METFDFFPLLIIGIFIFCYLVKILSEALEARKARLKREDVANGGATGLKLKSFSSSKHEGHAASEVIVEERVKMSDTGTDDMQMEPNYIVNTIRFGLVVVIGIIYVLIVCYCNESRQKRYCGQAYCVRCLNDKQRENRVKMSDTTAVLPSDSGEILVVLFGMVTMAAVISLLILCFCKKNTKTPHPDCRPTVGLKASEGVNQFKRLHMSRKFMYPTITPHHGTGSFAKCYLGGPQKTATTPKNIRKVATQIEQNPRRSGRKMAEKERMKHVLENELKVAPSKF